MGGDDAATSELTFLFTDIEASTIAWDRDESTMNAAQELHDAIVRSCISLHHGRVFSTAGDGVAAAFALASDAVQAAVDAQRLLRQERWPTEEPIRVRMGVHTGSAIERDGDYFGPTVIRAARLMSLVGGGRIICSAATREALTKPPLIQGLELLPVGTVQLKGLSMPEPAHVVRAPGLPELGEQVDGPLRPTWPRPQPTALVGREMLIDDVVDLVATSRLVSLVGSGGVGKTSVAVNLAEELAASFDHEVGWIDLATLTDPGAVVHQLASLLGVRAARGEDLMERITVAVGDRRLLLLLDNCEHVLDAARSLVRALLERCPATSIITTGRERLALAGERVVAVPPLATGDPESPAVRLLITRLGVDRDQLDAAERSALIELAARLDGIPLALELVAARCRRLGIAEVARRLPHQLGTLGDGSQASPRHRTLDLAIDWSYGLLTSAEQACLRALSAFNASFDLDAIEHVVAGDTAEVDEMVASLLDKSLLEHDGRRFRLLEMTRNHASRRLDASDERAAVLAAHTAYVRARVRQIRIGLHSRDEATWVEQLDHLWPDVRTIVRRCLDDDDAEAVIDLVTHLAFEAFWRRPEAFAWIEEATARYGSRPGPHRHELLGAGGVIAWTMHDVPEAIRLGSEAMAIDPAPGTALDSLPELAALGSYNFAGRFAEAAAAARGALPGLRRTSDRWSLSVMHASLALSLAVGGTDDPEVEQALDAAMAIAQSIGNPSAIAYAHYVRAIAQSAADPAAALAALEAARAYGAQVDNRWITSACATTIATMSRGAQPDLDRLALAVDAAEELHRTGWTIHAWNAMWGIIGPLHDLGRTHDAATVLGACEASGVARLAYQHVPQALDTDDEVLMRQRRLGAHLTVDDLVGLARAVSTVAAN